MTEQLKSDDKIFNMFKNYLELIAEDSFATSRNYKEPEVIAQTLTLAHQIDHAVCTMMSFMASVKKEAPPKAHKLEI